MTVEKLIEQLKRYDPKAKIYVEDYDENFNYNILYVDFTADGDAVVIVIDEE